MGCCARTQSNLIIKSSSIPLTCLQSLDEKENNLQNNSNIIANIGTPKQKMKSNKTYYLKIQKGKNKTEKKNIKTMNILKEISFNEVNETTKYFL